MVLGKLVLHLEKIKLDVYLTACIKAKFIIWGETDHQPRLDAWDKCSGLVHWEDSEGLGREGDKRGDWDGEYMQIHGWFMSMYDKNHYNIVK